MPKKDVLFIIGDWNAKVGSQEIHGVTGKFALGVQNEAGQRLTVLSREWMGHSKHPLPTTSVQFSRSVMYEILCDPMNHSTLGLPVHHPLLESHPNPCPLSRWCHPTISFFVVPFSSCPQSFRASGSFPMSQLFASGGQSVGVSASTSVLSMNTQDWSPLEWAGWISLQSKGLSRVFSNTKVQKHQFFCAQLSL